MGTLLSDSVREVTDKLALIVQHKSSHVFSHITDGRPAACLPARNARAAKAITRSSRDLLGRRAQTYRLGEWLSEKENRRTLQDILRIFYVHFNVPMANLGKKHVEF